MIYGGNVFQVVTGTRRKGIAELMTDKEDRGRVCFGPFYVK